ncbi:hypothetical protein ALC56_09268 [Trachymyrmex septentrionalis]|uniref:Uncharacterized protein n=1 Tax=Trachymyrmex septentrionalis TaxID=34720 RepID=A0A195F789_9HYME|nr:hypothetical protein ALC56_09268 [Trachymyrmex septentrionalis]
MTGDVELRQAWRIAQSILVVSVLPRRCRGCLETILPIEPVCAGGAGVGPVSRK